MYNRNNEFLNRGFTLVELLIAVAIITILSGAAYIGIQRARVNVMNTKVTVDLPAIENALEQYKQDHEGKYPVPTAGADKNLSCFYLDTAYAHDCAKADVIQSQIDNTLLTKRYLQEVPNDPRTGARYSYGVTTDGQYYQIAGIIENNDGSYTAKVTGNLHFTYPLKSLIRSYNGPRFVMDGEGYLPYSPDHLAITATLADIVGTVTIDGQSVTNDSTEEEKTVKPGSVISTAPGASATLYFSDGSVTYLGDSLENTTLSILPNTEVEQNDKDGIITKIRLKLFSGKIWNKVARLAQKSEFNVETTSAIAGVRGTEFGIEATGNKIIVFSGTVVAREMTQNEISQASGTDQYLEYDNTNAFFNGNQIINGNNAFKTFPVPAVNAVNPPTGTPVTGPALTDLKAKYYQTPYSNSLQPRINEVDVATNKLSFKLIPKALNNPFDFPKPNKVLVFDEKDYNVITWEANDFTIDSSGGTIDITTLGNFFTNNLNQKVTFAFEDENGNRTAKSHPRIVLKSNTKLTFAMLYGEEEVKVSGCTGTLSSVEVTGPITVKANSDAPYTAKALYTGPSCSKDVTTICSWAVTGIGTIGTDGKLHIPANAVGQSTPNCTFQTKTDLTPPVANVISEINGECWGADLAQGTSDDKGYWDGAACWVLGAPGNNCDATCGAPQIGASCEDASDGQMDWDDLPGNTICLALANTIQPPLVPATTSNNDAGTNIFFAPYLKVGGLNRCYSRHPNALAIVPDLCGTTQNITTEQRVCRCI